MSNTNYIKTHTYFKILFKDPYHTVFLSGFGLKTGITSFFSKPSFDIFERKNKLLTYWLIAINWYFAHPYNKISYISTWFITRLRHSNQVNNPIHWHKCIASLQKTWPWKFRLWPENLTNLSFPVLLYLFLYPAHMYKTDSLAS